MWVTEKVSREIVFSAADVWHIARSVLAHDFPGFTIKVGRRETPGRFAGGGLGAGVMLVVQDSDGYELDYGQRLLLEACRQDARDRGYEVPESVLPNVCRQALETHLGKRLPEDDQISVIVLHTETTGDRMEMSTVALGR